MAFRHGKFGQLSVNSVDLSSFLTSMELPVAPEVADTTTMGSTWRSSIAGLLGATLSFEGLFDPTATTGPASALWTVFTGLAPVAVVHKPGGTASGQRTNSFSALMTAYDESSTLDGAITFSAEMVVTGAITPTTQ